MSSLFGQPSTGTSLFGQPQNNTTQQNTGGGLFGSLGTNTATSQSQQGRGLFGSTNTSNLHRAAAFSEARRNRQGQVFLGQLPHPSQRRAEACLVPPRSHNKAEVYLALHPPRSLRPRGVSLTGSPHLRNRSSREVDCLEARSHSRLEVYLAAHHSHKHSRLEDYSVPRRNHSRLEVCLVARSQQSRGASSAPHQQRSRGPASLANLRVSRRMRHKAPAYSI